MVVGEATHAGQQARLHTRHAWREEWPPVNLRGRTNGSFYAIKAFLPPDTFCQVLPSLTGAWAAVSSRGGAEQNVNLRILGAELKF